MSQNTLWKYGENEFECDLTDADTFERYWDACEKLGERENDLKNSEGDRSFIRRYCAMFREFFDTTLGDGASDKLFGGKSNTRACEAAYDDFITFAGQQVRETNSAHLNRSQRRNQEKGNRQHRNNYGGRR